MNASLALLAETYQQEHVPDRAAATRYFQGLEDLSNPELSKKTRKALEVQVCRSLVEAVVPEPERVKAYGDVAGKYSNFQNLLGDVINWSPQIAAATMKAMNVDPKVNSLVSFAMATICLLYTPYLGAIYLQAMLNAQRQTRRATSIEYGEAALPDKAFEEMDKAKVDLQGKIKQARQGGVEAGMGQLVLASADKLETERGNYEHAHESLVQRSVLNAPESDVRRVRAALFAAGGWAAYGVQLHQPDNKVPVTLIVQAAVTLMMWVVHFVSAGPRRDERILNEQLKVDVRKKGPPQLANARAAQAAGEDMALEAPAADGAAPTHHQIQSVTDADVESLKDMIKQVKVVQRDNVITLFKADRRPDVEMLSKLLKLTQPQVKEYYTSVESKPMEARTQEETQLYHAVQAAVLGLDDAGLTKHTEAMAVLKSIDHDLALVNQPDRWSEISSMSRKTKLKDAMTKAPDKMTLSRALQFVFRGSSASDPLIRTSHLLANESRAEWMTFAGDFRYKEAKTLQFLGVGSSSFPFVAGNLESVLSAFGRPVNWETRAALTVIGLGAYMLAEKYSGHLVNDVIAGNLDNKENYPYGRPPSWERRLEDGKRLGKNTLLVVTAAIQDFQMARGSKEAAACIEEAHALLTAMRPAGTSEPVAAQAPVVPFEEALGGYFAELLPQIVGLPEDKDDEWVEPETAQRHLVE